MRKIILFIILSLTLVGCSQKNTKEENARMLIQSLYEVNDYDRYEAMIERAANYKENTPEEIMKPYIEEYKEYMTEECLDSIFAQGLATYFDSIAYENKVYIEIQDIELDEYANEESNYYYNYTVKLKIISDEMSVITEGSGKIDLIKELNDNYKVSYIKKLSNGKIKKAIEEMWIYLHVKELQEIYDEKEANNIKDGLIECFKKSKIV